MLVCICKYSDADATACAVWQDEVVADVLVGVLWVYGKVDV
jgi:hypothetical protein